MRLKKYFYLIPVCLLVLLSCDSYLDINDDPNLPTSAELKKLLTGAEREIGYSFSPGYYIGSSLQSYVFHLTSREVDNFSITPTYSTLTNTWGQAYVYGLKNVDAMITAAEAGGNLIYAGVGKLLKAYTFAQLVDLWGDIPYSEYNVPENYAPAVDKSQDIYKSLLSLIDAGVADLNNTEAGNLLKPGSDDLFYKGDKNKWIRMANTLKLKLLVQSRKAKDQIEGWNQQLTQLLAENNFMKSGEDLELKHTKQDNPDERHPAYVDEYLGGQSTYYISPWLYETMKGMDLNVKNNPFVGIVDPRIPYYWVNQIKNDATAQNNTDYRDGAFVSIFFASAGAAAANDQRVTSTFIGIYPCGGKYDDGEGGKCSEAVGNGIAPEKMLQAYSVPFLLAELYLAKEVDGDAKAKLEEGIRLSIAHVNAVTKASDETAPVITNEKITEFVTKILAKYDAASTDLEKLRIVMTQKWITNFFNPIEAYSDIRRTGYPTLLPQETQFAQSPFKNNKEPEPGPVNIPLKGINAYPRAMWYPNTEVTRNGANVTNVGRDLSAKILFWDK
jgi:hypothetical protein